jgi:GNAT superfamily N-acetyltransferase
MQLETVVADALFGCIPGLARLRMTVFREYPYLYDGSEAYEAGYLRTYTTSGEALAVLARDGDAIVGASTGIPLGDETEAFVRPFEALGLDPATVFYCGESVLLPAWRGRGLYRAFFEARETYARGLGGILWMSFCGVVRSENHPLRPPQWEPLDAALRRFGFAPEPKLPTSYAWKDIDQSASTEHTMQFWLKPLG